MNKFRSGDIFAYASYILSGGRKRTSKHGAYSHAPDNVLNPYILFNVAYRIELHMDSLSRGRNNNRNDRHYIIFKIHTLLEQTALKSNKNLPVLRCFYRDKD